MRKTRAVSLGIFNDKDIENEGTIFDEFSDMKISKLTISEGSFAEGRSPVAIELRKKTGVTLLAIKRGELVIEHPVPDTIFHKNDIIYLFGDDHQIGGARPLFQTE